MSSSGRTNKKKMPTNLANKFVTVEGINYSFDYVLVPRTRPGKTEIEYNFFAAVPDYSYRRARPKKWIYLKMTADEYVVYRPTQPFVLAADPVADFVTFVDFNPTDKRDKYKTIRILMESSPGIWPAKPTTGQTMIATQIDVDAVARMLDDEEEAKKQPTLKKKDKINPATMDAKNQKPIESTLEKPMTTKLNAKDQPNKSKVQPDKTKVQPDKVKTDKAKPDKSKDQHQKREKPKSEDQIRKEVTAELEKKYEERERRLHQQIRRQQHQIQQLKPHRALGLPSPDLAHLLSQPDNQHRGPATKRHSLDRSLEYKTASPEVTPERTRKLPAQHHLWMQSRYPPKDPHYDRACRDY